MLKKKKKERFISPTYNNFLIEILTFHSTDINLTVAISNEKPPSNTNMKQEPLFLFPLLFRDNNSPHKSIISTIIPFRSMRVATSTPENETDDVPSFGRSTISLASINPSIHAHRGRFVARRGDLGGAITSPELYYRRPGQRPSAPTDGYSRFVSLSNRRYALYAWETLANEQHR